jgi:predicted nucleotidyltransferase
MLSKSSTSTSFPEVNDILQELLKSIRGVLGSHFIGMYLEGSLANGDFDQDSDIDFVVVTDEDVAENLFLELRAMHERIATINSWCAIQLEGSYISRHALRRHDPEHALHPNIERGDGESLKMFCHDESWIVHRYILRERGITLIGPDPKTLIDPIARDELRMAMLPILNGWATQILNHPDEIINRGYQAYIVLTLCRILYTLQFGDVVSKAKAAGWIKETTDKSWKLLIDRARISRHNNPQLMPGTEEVNQTLGFIRYVLERSRQVERQQNVGERNQL